MIKRRQLKKRPTGDCEVGYGKPPVQNRFKPGQSGNPKGRPKGLRNLKTDIQELLRSPISVSIDGKKRRVSAQMASLLRLVRRGLDGDVRAIALLVKLAEAYNSEEPPGDASVTSDADLELLRVFEERIARGAVDGLGQGNAQSERPAPPVGNTLPVSSRAGKRRSVPRVRPKRDVSGEER